jgi:hypothetical protein
MANLKEEIMVSDELLKAAPGKVSITSDVWSVDTTKTGFMGMTAH